MVRGDWPLAAVEQDPDALSAAIRGCARTGGYRRTDRIVCKEGLEVMVDGKARGGGPRGLEGGPQGFRDSQASRIPSSPHGCASVCIGLLTGTI